MTREEAMDLVESAFDAWEYQYDTGDDWSREHEARDMAIKALKQEPCEDAISRHAVLETIDNRIEQLKRDVNEINKSYSHLSFAEGIHDGYCRLKCDLRILPSVTPQPKNGKWLKGNSYGDQYNYYQSCVCSCCKREYDVHGWNYCPNCGAKMKEVEE